MSTRAFNDKYFWFFLRIFILYFVIEYLLFGHRSIVRLLVEGTIISTVSTLLIKAYLGKDVGIYKFASQFSIRNTKDILIDKLKAFVNSKKGEIFSGTDNTLVINFGKRFSLLRLLSYSWATKIDGFILPCKIRIVILEQPSQLAVELNYEDNMHSGFIHTELYQRTFEQYFKKIDKALKDWIEEV